MQRSVRSKCVTAGLYCNHITLIITSLELECFEVQAMLGKDVSLFWQFQLSVLFFSFQLISIYSFLIISGTRMQECGFTVVQGEAGTVLKMFSGGIGADWCAPR